MISFGHSFIEPVLIETMCQALFKILYSGEENK